jgi:hypothetical protein
MGKGWRMFTAKDVTDLNDSYEDDADFSKKFDEFMSADMQKLLLETAITMKAFNYSASDMYRNGVLLGILLAQREHQCDCSGPCYEHID